MATVKTNDVITEQAIQETVRGYVEEDLMYRRAFSSMDISGLANDTVEVPIEQDNMAEPTYIAEGSEFPHDEEDIETVTATVKKYGGAVRISREAQQDSLFDVVSRNVNKQSRKMAELFNRKAYDALSSNVHPDSPVSGSGGTSGTLEFTDVVEATKTLNEDGYSPSYLITNPQGKADLLRSEEFQRATDLGDETILEAQVGRVGGLDVFSSNAGLMSGASAFVVDDESYGWEITKEAVSTNEYVDEARHSTEFQIWSRRSWLVTDPNAAVKIEG